MTSRHDDLDQFVTMPRKLLEQNSIILGTLAEKVDYLIGLAGSNSDQLNKMEAQVTELAEREKRVPPADQARILFKVC